MSKAERTVRSHIAGLLERGADAIRDARDDEASDLALKAGILRVVLGDKTALAIAAGAIREGLFE